MLSHYDKTVLQLNPTESPPFLYRICLILQMIIHSILRYIRNTFRSSADTVYRYLNSDLCVQRPSLKLFLLYMVGLKLSIYFLTIYIFYYIYFHFLYANCIFSVLLYIFYILFIQFRNITNPIQILDTDVKSWLYSTTKP